MSRNDQGEYTARTTDKEMLAHFSQATRPFQTAQSIAEQFDIDRSQAYRRLQQLADEDVLEKAKVGGRAVVWWIPDTDESSKKLHDVNSNDPIFNRDTFEAGEPSNTSEKIDEVLYGDGASESV